MPSWLVAYLAIHNGKFCQYFRLIIPIDLRFLFISILYHLVLNFLITLQNFSMPKYSITFHILPSESNSNLYSLYVDIYS